MSPYLRHRYRGTVAAPRRRWVRAVNRALVATAVALLCACSKQRIELLAPRQDGGIPVSPKDAGSDADVGTPAPIDSGQLLPDAGLLPDSGVSTCAPGMVFCEGFESNLTGWTFLRSDGMATITTLDSHSGTGALELATRAEGAFAYFDHAITPEVKGGALHLRAFVKLPVDQKLDSFDFIVLTNATSDGGAAVSYRDPLLTAANLAGTASAMGTSAFPRGVWVCVEVALTVSASSAMAVDLNGTRNAMVNLNEGAPAGGYARVRLGVVRSSVTQKPMRMLLDDLSIATSRVGCK